MSVKDLKTTQFFQNLTQNSAGIKSARATLVAKQVYGELETIIQSINNELNQLELTISAHEDLSPNNEYSLEIATKDFKAAEWIQQYHDMLDVKRLKEEQLAIYESIKARQFGEPVKETENE